jgi:hypothetical protein
MGNKYNIISDPEANILYQKCRDVDESLWEALNRANPAEVALRTGVPYVQGKYLLPFLNRQLWVDPIQRQILGREQSPEEPEFQLCLTALLFLLNVDARQLPSRQVSPREYKGGVVFFRGPHALPTARLEESLGSRPKLFLNIGLKLGGTEVAQGDAAVALQPYPNLNVEVILWLGDEEFPPQIILTTPAALERYWPLDAIWALLNVVTREFWRAADAARIIAAGDITDKN